MLNAVSGIRAGIRSLPISLSKTSSSLCQGRGVTRVRAPLLLPDLRFKSESAERIKPFDLALSAVADARKQIIASSNLHQISTLEAPAESEKLKLPDIKDNFGRYLEFEEWQLFRKREIFVSKYVAWLRDHFQCDQYQIPASARLRKIFMTEQLNKLCPYGNCSALAETSFLTLYRNGQFPLELIHQFSSSKDKSYSHAYVVMNREKGSSLKAQEEWGEDCLLVDAWVPAVFYADQYPAMKEWLPTAFSQDDVYSVIRLESRLENAERPAVEFKTGKELEEEPSSSE
ncbi:MAG: hypothetical protein ACR2PX_12465 [Endozoicomonas sp.]|uniref:hypothetical protein n=1 Tax=Endozoicomonas sp. TaxID=1892382 RepID=UPI003D9AFD19